MVEFADVVSILLKDDFCLRLSVLQDLLSKVNRVIELDPHKCTYFVLHSELHEAFYDEEKALADLTQAIQIAENQETEWLLGLEELFDDFWSFPV